MGPFRPRSKVTLKTLWEVPVDIIEDADALAEWALEAIAAQQEATLIKENARARRGRKKLDS